MNSITDIKFEDYKDQPGLFINKLYKIYLTHSAKNKQVIKNLILDINKNKEVDICQLSLDGLNSGVSVFNIVDLIADAFPYLNHNIDSLLDFSRSCYLKMANDLTSYKQYEPIKKLAKEQPLITKAFLERLLNTNEEFVIGYITTIFESFSFDNHNKIHEELIILTEKKEEFIIQGIVLALSAIKYPEDCSQNLIEKTINTYAALLQRNSISLDSSIAWALKPFIDKIQKAEFILKKLADRKEPIISYQISRILNVNTPASIKKPWFSEILYTLSTMKCEISGTVNNIDHVLSQLIVQSDTTNIHEKFLKDWLNNSNYIHTNIDIGKIFDSTLISLNENEEKLYRLITILFNSDESSCHRAASEIINYSNLHFKKQIKFDSNLLNELDFDSILFICRKVLGYLVSAKNIHSLLLSIAQQFKNDKKVVSLICEIYQNYLSKDYLDTTIKVLEEDFQKIENSFLKDSIVILIRTLKERNEHLNSLLQLKELSVSKRNYYQISLEESKKMNESMKISEKSSLINILGVRNVPLKYGNGWFSYVDGQYSDIRKLSLFSTSVELPRTEITHPVTSTILRLGFRLAKRYEE